MKIVIQLDAESYFAGFTNADESPLEPDVYHLPAGCIDAPSPLPIPDGFRAFWNGYNWENIEVPKIEPEPEPELTIADLRAKAALSIVGKIEDFTAYFTKGYPSAELQSWPTKAADAAAVIAGGSSAIIAAEANARGVTELEMAQTIAGNSAVYLSRIGALSGIRGKFESAIAAAEDSDAVTAAYTATLLEISDLAASVGLPL